LFYFLKEDKKKEESPIGNPSLFILESKFSF